MLITILATVVVLGVLIFVHELGHFVTAKLVDIEVPRFSIGLGPKLWGFRWGETEYVISWLPLGGYVKMAGMAEMERLEGGPVEDRAGKDGPAGVEPASDVGLLGEESRPGPRDFESKSLPARAFVLSAGVLMNLLFAVLVFGGSAWTWGVPFVPDARVADVAEERLPAGAEPLADVPQGARLVAVGDREVDDWDDVQRAVLASPPGPVPFRFRDAAPVVIDLPADQEERADVFLAMRPAVDPVVGSVLNGSPAAAAGLRAGDRILTLDGRPVESWQGLVERVRERPGERVQITLRRDGEVIPTALVPEATEMAVGEDGETDVIGRIGISLPRQDPGIVESAAYGVAETWRWIEIIVGFLVDLAVGDLSPRNLGGPILIGQVSGEVARAGIEPLLRWMGLFSVNLAILNLLPIPLLDGGHLFFLAIEAVRGRALSLESRMRLSQVGFVIVVAIMLWAIASDVLRLFGL